jgi:hypothetical protein
MDSSWCVDEPWPDDQWPSNRSQKKPAGRFPQLVLHNLYLRSCMNERGFCARICMIHRSSWMRGDCQALSVAATSRTCGQSVARQRFALRRDDLDPVREHQMRISIPARPDVLCVGSCSARWANHYGPSWVATDVACCPSCHARHIEYSVKRHKRKHQTKT